MRGGKYHYVEPSPVQPMLDGVPGGAGENGAGELRSRRERARANYDSRGAACG